MLKWNIRNQILGLGGVSLIVLIGVIVYFYNFSRSELIKSSQEALRLTNIQYADALDRTFAGQSKTFKDWVREDVFGLAIEFSTTSELGQQFNQWLASSGAFAAVVLTDQYGTVLESAKSSTAEGIQVTKGIRIAGFTMLSASGADAVTALDPETVRQLGLRWPAAHAFYHPSYSSSGDFNGALIAVTDWSQIETLISNCNQAVASQGYDECMALIGGADVRTRGPVAVSTTGMVSDGTALADLAEAGSNAQDRSVVSIDSEQGTQLVAVSALTPPLLSDKDKSELSLMTVVPRDQVTSKLNAALLKILLGGLFGTMLLLGICFYLARNISRRVSRGAEIAKAMAAGDVNRKVDISGHDELGDLGAAFNELAEYMRQTATAAERIAGNDLTVDVAPKSDKDVLGNSFQKMVVNLTSIVRQLGQSAHELVTAANEVASSADAMSNGASTQTDQMTQISTAIEEMTATIVESSKNAGQASDGARGAADTANSGGLIVSETIQGMQRIAAVVRESAESITKLAKSADQIGEIIGVINDIADQTNLLALNAAIEAARAGEQGRGFAVVADEVRKLAERTGAATREIAEMIKGIQGQTEEAVNSMENGIQEVDKGRELADRAGNSLTEIVTMSQRVTDMIQQIATAAEEQSCAAEEISKSVEKVSTIAKESAGGARRSAAASEELNRQAEAMQSMVAKFRVNG